MTALKLKNSDTVHQAIEDAAAAACNVLDSQFPGSDAGGITSNFQGLLAEVITQMLKGHSVLDGLRGHTTTLPRLIVDTEFFGCPVIRGDLFLVHKPEKSVLDSALVLEPGASVFCPIANAGDAFTSFEAAAEAAMKYLVNEGLTLEQAKELNLVVVPVVVDPNSGTDRGYKAPTLQRAAAHRAACNDLEKAWNTPMPTFQSTIEAYHGLLNRSPGNALVIDKGLVAVLIDDKVFCARESDGVVDTSGLVEFDSDSFDSARGCWGGDGEKTKAAIDNPRYLALPSR